MTRGPIKLSVADVYAIRQRYVPYCPRNGGRALARRYRVHRQTVYDIIHRKLWPHV